MAKCIMVISGKGGTGKTTFSAALGAALAEQGARVICMDLDSGMGNLDLQLGMHEAAVFSVEDVLSGARTAEEAAAPVPGFDGLSILCAPRPGFVPEKEPLAALCRELTEREINVILDLGAGLGPCAEAAREAADLAMVVCLPEPSSLRDATGVAQFLQERPRLPVRLVCNRIPTRPGLLRKREVNVDACMDTVGLPLGAMIREDPKVADAAAGCRPLLGEKRSPAARDVREAARRLSQW